MTAGTVVCWSMTSETHTRYGSRSRRQDRGRRWILYQASSRPAKLLLFSGLHFGRGRRDLPVLRLLGPVLQEGGVHLEEIVEPLALDQDLLLGRILAADEQNDVLALVLGIP